MKATPVLRFVVAWFVVIALFCFAGCKRARMGVSFPASGDVAGWQKTGDTRTFAARDLWQYIDGDAEQYVKAGVVSTWTADYNYQSRLEAVVDVHVMGNAEGARAIFDKSQAADAKPVQLGDGGVAYSQSVTFRKGVYLVRIVAYQSYGDGPQALMALAHGVESKL